MECGTCTENRVDPIYFSISMPVHARGWITEPKLYVLFESPTTRALTLNVFIGDLNGKQISDVYTATIPAGTRFFVRDLGDFIDAQRLAKSIPPGIYTLIVSVMYGSAVIDVSGFVIFLVDTALNITPREDITDVFIVDTWTGLSTRGTKYQPLPADERYTIFVLSRRGDLGRIEVYQGGLPVYDSGYHRYVQVRMKKKFTSLEQLFDYVLSNSYIPLFIAREILREAEAGNKAQLIKALMPYYVSKNVMPGYIGSSVDTAKLEVVDEFLMFFGWFNWDDFAKKLISGLALTGCVVGAGVLSVKSFGTALPVAYALVKGCVSGAVVGSGIGLGVSVVRSFFIENTSPPPTPAPPEPPPPPPPPEEIDYYRQLFEESKATLENLLKLWRDQGRITLVEFETAVQHLVQMKEMYESTLKDMKDYAETIYKQAWNEAWKKGWDEGYTRGREDERKKTLLYTVSAGAGGLVLGVLIGRR
ncbi:MAG: hypothetical protein QXJ97_12555 [Desulfurococcaceae archaeon]